MQQRAAIDDFRVIVSLEPGCHARVGPKWFVVLTSSPSRSLRLSIHRTYRALRLASGTLEIAGAILRISLPIGPLKHLHRLILTIAGCVPLYHFGLPAGVDPTSAVHIILEQRDEAEVAAGKRYRTWGRVGITLIAVGSGFQIWANWAG